MISITVTDKIITEIETKIMTAMVEVKVVIVIMITSIILITRNIIIIITVNIIIITYLSLCNTFSLFWTSVLLCVKWQFKLINCDVRRFDP